MDKNALIFIAGATGMVGSAVKRQLVAQGYTNIICPSKHELDLLNQVHVANFFSTYKPDYVYFVAGKVGGIYANNSYRADFIYENLQMTCNVIHQSYLSSVKRLLFFACNCIYPKNSVQPMQESAIGGGILEPTSDAFATAKLAGVKMCESYNRQYGTDFLSIIPSNVYGLNQSYEPLNSLVIPSLIHRMALAKRDSSDSLVIWGTGEARRDFIFADDLASAAIFLMSDYEGNNALNVGSGCDYSIKFLAKTLKKLMNYKGKLIFDNDFLGGVDKKELDIEKIKSLGWKPSISLDVGLNLTIKDFYQRNVNFEDK